MAENAKCEVAIIFILTGRYVDVQEISQNAKTLIEILPQ